MFGFDAARKALHIAGSYLCKRGLSNTGWPEDGMKTVLTNLKRQVFKNIAIRAWVLVGNILAFKKHIFPFSRVPI